MKPRIEHNTGAAVKVRDIDRDTALKLGAAVEKAFKLDGWITELRVQNDGITVELRTDAILGWVEGYCHAWLEREAEAIEATKRALDAAGSNWQAMPRELSGRAYFTADLANQILYSFFRGVMPPLRGEVPIFTQTAGRALHHALEALQTAEGLHAGIASIGGLAAEKEAAAVAEHLGKAVEILSFRLLSLRGAESGSGRPRPGDAPPTPPSPAHQGP